MSQRAGAQLRQTILMTAPVAKTATFTSTAVDLANTNENTIVVALGAYTDSTVTAMKLQESSDNSTFTDVAAADMVGSFTNFSTNAQQNTYQRVSYIGSLRYVRFGLTVSGATTGFLIGVSAEVKVRKQP